MKYTREQLVALGMSEAQINAILNVYEASQAEAPGVVETKEVPVAPAPAAVAPVELKVTSISDLHMYGQGKVVRLPDFAEGQPFVARVRRPSMLVLAKEGKIPNALLNAANELFAGGGSGMDADNPQMLHDLYSICEVVAKAALLEPTYDDIVGAGIELSDNQMMALFSYTQNGVKALEPFR